MFARLPQLNSLRVFEAAARLGSFKQAAVELSVTPTAVSHQVRGLESALGVQLFLREARSVTLTDEGRRLADSVNSALGTLAGAIEETVGRNSVLTVSTTTSFAALWLVPRLPDFRASIPGLDVRVRTSETPEQLELQSGIDLAIRYGGKPAVSEGTRLDGKESFGAYWNPANLRKRPGSGSLLARAVLLETRWQNPHLPAIGWQQWLARYSPKIRSPRVRSFDTELHALQAAMTGEGIVLASSLLASMAVQYGWLEPYRGERLLPGLHYRVVVTPGRQALPRVKAFCRWFAAAMAAHAQPRESSAQHGRAAVTRQS